ncbi:hypothetical protein [Actinacidiphila oryziradicis]|uniref:Uncharacterized protein n=1 Tax=Actinacidiphila oryziradicis TaxID=2571141 RepID=A0A4V5N0R9_9ACTN|nr:hypothetical protein [Actinacidiphila oryziradicis]TKA13089.1 hypothetical protein FCI23_03655 [Actinacidiphila oryziradicis]
MAQNGLVAAADLGRGRTTGEVGEGAAGGVVVGGLEVDQGLVGGGGLLFVVAGVVPVGCSYDEQDQSGEQDRDAVSFADLVEELLGRIAELAGLLVVGADL